jgi:hypothetical protein
MSITVLSVAYPFALVGPDALDAEACRRAACERFDLERMVQSYLQVYQPLAVNIRGWTQSGSYARE